MARTKNRDMKAISYLNGKRRWRVGKYVRLSKEDLNRGKDDSNSIVNQRKILDEYYLSHMDDFSSEVTYCDDGYTGTDSNREGFQKLLADVMNKKIDCVIVKDLSRLSRNYTGPGA